MNHVDDMTRRGFLVEMAAIASVTAARFQPSPIPIIDTHIHLFDQTRPQGAPYAGGRPPGSTAPTLPSYPPRYRALARPLGIVGAIAVEASPWVEDNLWVLQVAQTDTMVVGVIGNLRRAIRSKHSHIGGSGSCLTSCLAHRIEP